MFFWKINLILSHRFNIRLNLGQIWLLCQMQGLTTNLCIWRSYNCQFYVSFILWLPILFVRYFMIANSICPLFHDCQFYLSFISTLLEQPNICQIVFAAFYSPWCCISPSEGNNWLGGVGCYEWCFCCTAPQGDLSHYILTANWFWHLVLCTKIQYIPTKSIII